MKNLIGKDKKVHMVGIKGVGMTALAEILLAQGMRVSGSDVVEIFMTDAVLARLSIPVYDFDALHTRGMDMVIYSQAYTADHVEIHAAQAAGIPLFSYPEALAALSAMYKSVAVAGSHGKTTTTAMLAHILHYAKKEPHAIVGSIVVNWGSGALTSSIRGDAGLFVFEADEYKEAFLRYYPYGAIMTNIDYDHPDYFKDSATYTHAFAQFITRIPQEGFLIINGDDRVLCDIAEKYATCKIKKVTEKNSISFSLHLPGCLLYTSPSPRD